MTVTKGSNSANFFNKAIIPTNNPINLNGAIATSVGTNGGPSAYGTYDQSGNIWEWVAPNSQTKSNTSRILRGGSFSSSSIKDLNKNYGRLSTGLFLRKNNIGFRIATKTNPLSLNNFLLIEDINNSSDNNGYGAVSFSFMINAFSVTVCEYVDFLNAVAAQEDTYNLYDYVGMNNFITQLTNFPGGPVKYSYFIKHPFLKNKPITSISYLETARYCNWLHNGKPIGNQNIQTTENGAYYLNGMTAGSVPSAKFDASYYIPTENEWYKSAYYKGNGTNSGYWLYATQSDSDIQPIAVSNIAGDGPIVSYYLCGSTTPPPTPTPSGPTPTADPSVTPTVSIGINSVNFLSQANWTGSSGDLTTVGTNGGASFYGTYDQNGNVYEWSDWNEITGIKYRNIMGGSFQSNIYGLKSSSPSIIRSILSRTHDTGFRIATNSNNLNLSNFVTIVDPNNKGMGGIYGSLGSVNYIYKINKFTVTNCDYVEFLNAVASDDKYGLFSTKMASNSRGGIIRNGTSGNYTYNYKNNFHNKPANFVNWFCAIRYINWLHNGKPNGAQNSSTTEDGAYTISDPTSDLTIAKNNNANYWLPNANEWFKAAYYKGNGSNSGYWLYATQNNINPIYIQCNNKGDGPINTTYICASLPQGPTPTPPMPTPALTQTPTMSIGSNTANWNKCAVWGSADNVRVTTVGSNGGSSSYGCFDMSGNIWEWNDLNDTINYKKGLRGGSWNSTSVSSLSSSIRVERTLTYKYSGLGFRVATKTNEYSSFGLSEFAYVSDSANTNDATGYGSVNYPYYISKYPVTNCEYSQFLNSVAFFDPYNLFDSLMSFYGGIIRTGTLGNYEYDPAPNASNKPVIYINWLRAARYCNWLHWGKPVGGSSVITETGAYNLYGNTNNFNVFPKNTNAKYYIPTENEWYKAAFYKGGGTNAGYWKYATQSDSAPSCITSNTNGDGPNLSSYPFNFTFPNCS